MRSPSTSNLDPGRDPDELELGDKPRRPLLRAGPKRVAENPPDRFLGVLLAINRHRPARPARELPGVVEPKQVVGMSVRECDRVDESHVFAQELDPHLGRCVDQQVARRGTRARRWAGCADSEDRSKCRPSSRSRSWERRSTSPSREKSVGASAPRLVRSTDPSSPRVSDG